MRSKSGQIVVIAALLFFAFSFFLSHSASAQDEGRRTIRVKDSAARVGASREETRSEGGQPNLWAVLIGVSRYEYGDQPIDVNGFEIKNLKYANEDAQAMYDFLQSPEGGGFRDENEGGHMVLLKDEDATRANVERALDKLTQSKPNDYFIIFIAAHGALLAQPDPTTNKMAQVPYFVLFDSNLTDPKGTALRMDSFSERVNHIPARKGLVLSDTCHSAGVQLGGRGAGSPTSGVNGRYIEQVQKTVNGVGYLWSADQFEEAFELGYLGNGIFTYCLLEGLRGNADADRNGIVSFNELVNYVRAEVPKLSDDKQHPYASLTTTDILEGKVPLPLAVIPYADSGAQGGADRYGTLVIRTPDLVGVEVAIDGAYLEEGGRAVRVKQGAHKLSFSKGAMRKEVLADVEGNRSTLVEVNLTFTQSDSKEDSLVDPAEGVLNVYLTEDKTPSAEATKLFQEGFDNFKKQKFDAAAALFNQAIKANGGAYAEAYVFLGRAQQSLGLKKEAVESFTRAMTLRPTDYQTNTLLQEAKFNAGYNVDEVIKELNRIKLSHDHDGYVRVVLGDVLMLRKEFYSAERELRQATRLLPTSPPAHMILAEAITYQRSKAKQKQAVEEAQKAIDLFEKLAQKQVSFARGLRRLSISHVVFGGGRYVDYAGMSDAHRTLADATVTLVSLDDSLTDPDSFLARARTSIEESMRLATKNKDRSRQAPALDLSAQIYVLKGQPERAITEAEQALKLSDMDDIKGEVHFTLSTAYEGAQKFGRAAEHLQKYLALSGSQLLPKERKGIEERLENLNRLKEVNRQK